MRVNHTGFKSEQDCYSGMAYAPTSHQKHQHVLSISRISTHITRIYDTRLVKQILNNLIRPDIVNKSGQDYI